MYDNFRKEDHKLHFCEILSSVQTKIVLSNGQGPGDYAKKIRKLCKWFLKLCGAKSEIMWNYAIWYNTQIRNENVQKNM